MIYAVDDPRSMLVEFKSMRALDIANSHQSTHMRRYRPVSAEYAHNWVKKGYTHETGLYLDGGRVRYAPSDPGV